MGRLGNLVCGYPSHFFWGENFFRRKVYRFSWAVNKKLVLMLLVIQRRPCTTGKVRDRCRPYMDEYGLDDTWWPYETEGGMWPKFPDICPTVDENPWKKPQSGNKPDRGSNPRVRSNDFNSPLRHSADLTPMRQARKWNAYSGRLGWAKFSRARNKQDFTRNKILALPWMRYLVLKGGFKV